MIDCHALSFGYSNGPVGLQVLNNLSVTLDAGDSHVILGPSGSGKTTLLSILGCLLAPVSGAVYLQGISVPFEDKQRLLEIRRDLIGFVFQRGQLLPFLTAQENVMLSYPNTNITAKCKRQRAGELFDVLGINSTAHKLPSELSGGERQRVAIARALVKSPKILLADEPTAALDWNNGEKVVDLMTAECRKENAVLVMVTHDLRVVKLFDRCFELLDGRLTECELYR